MNHEWMLVALTLKKKYQIKEGKGLEKDGRKASKSEFAIELKQKGGSYSKCFL